MGTCLWYKWLTMQGAEEWEEENVKKKDRRTVPKWLLKRLRARETSTLWLQKVPLERQSLATTVLLNWGHAMHMKHKGSKPLQLSAIWRYEKTGMGGRESDTPPLTALWQIVYIGWGNSQQAKEASTTGCWQWAEFEGAQNRVLCLSWDTIMPSYLQTEGALYPSWPVRWAGSLMMFRVRLGLGLRG